MCDEWFIAWPVPEFVFNEPACSEPGPEAELDRSPLRLEVFTSILLREETAKDKTRKRNSRDKQIYQKLKESNETFARKWQ